MAFCVAIAAALSTAVAIPAHAFEAEALDSVVSVLPQWPGRPAGGQRNPLSGAPEGSAVAIRDGGYLVTAAHVLGRARDIKVRLADGRVLPADIVASDAATDLAILKIESDLPIMPTAPRPSLGDPVCAIGNTFGLDLGVTCGVVSALDRAGTGFNPIEDFIQTDASVNPGASGGALVDAEGRLVGVLSAIFTKDSDADIGVNFATSMALVHRVADDLIEQGRVLRARPGLRTAPLPEARRAELAGILVEQVSPGGAADSAGLRPGDVIVRIAGRTIRSEADMLSAIHLHRPGDQVTVFVIRDGTARQLDMILAE